MNFLYIFSLNYNKNDKILLEITIRLQHTGLTKFLMLTI